MQCGADRTSAIVNDYTMSRIGAREMYPRKRRQVARPAALMSQGRCIRKGAYPSMRRGTVVDP